MELNFYDHYQTYSNIELLKILRHPGDYQPAAVEAATLILKERDVSQHEHEAAASHFEAIEQNQRSKQEKIAFIKSAVLDLLDPIINPRQEFNPVKWLNLLLVVTAVDFLWGLIRAVLTGSFFLVAWFGHGGVVSYFLVFLDIVLWIYTPLVLYLAYKRKRWGWILLFGGTEFIIVSSPVRIYSILRFFDMFGPGSLYFFVWLIVYCFMLSLLWKNKVSDLFGVSHKTKKDTALIVLIGTPILQLFMYTLLK